MEQRECDECGTAVSRSNFARLVRGYRKRRADATGGGRDSVSDSGYPAEWVRGRNASEREAKFQL